MPIARAVQIHAPGGVEVLHIGQIEVRDPGPFELLVRVAAAGLNRADLLQRRGLYPAPAGVASDVPGLEYAGTVEAVGPGVCAFAPGDRVLGIVPGAAMATRLVVHEGEAMTMPAALNFAEAAAVPEAFLTAYDALFLQAELKMGETLLIHAAGSGVGTAAVQLARAAGVRTIGTARSEAKIERCAALGLDYGLTTVDGRFADVVRALTADAGADVVLDLVGGSYVEEDLRAVAQLGRIVVVGLVGGASAQLPLGLLLARRARLLGTVLRSRPLDEKIALAQRFARRILPLFDAGRLVPVIDEVLPMSRIRDAHTRLESNQTFGKLVLVWDE